MTDAIILTEEQVDAQFTRIRAMMAQWINRLALDRWTITVEITSKAGTLDSDGGPMNGTAADCLPEWEYEKAAIRFDGVYASTCSDRELERHIIHELLHCTMDEGDIRNRKHEEHMVVTLTRAFMDMRKGHECPNTPSVSPS